MLEVSANTCPLRKDVHSRLGRARILVAEDDLVMNPVADRSNSRPTRRLASEQLHSDVRESIDLTVTAVEQILQGVRWQFSDRMLLRIRGGRIRLSRIFYHCNVAEPEGTLWCHEPGTSVPESVDITFDVYRGRHCQIVGSAQVRGARGMNVQHADDRDRRGYVEADIIADTDKHELRSLLPQENEVPQSVPATLAGTSQYCGKLSMILKLYQILGICSPTI